MIRDITLGQYYQTESIIHRLDPRTKLMGTLVYLVSLFIIGTLRRVIVIRSMKQTSQMSGLLDILMIWGTVS